MINLVKAQEPIASGHCNFDEGFYSFVGLGLAVGGLNRVLMRGGIKGIPKVEQVGFAKRLKKEYFNPNLCGSML